MTLREFAGRIHTIDTLIRAHLVDECIILQTSQVVDVLSSGCNNSFGAIFHQVVQ